MAHSIQLLDVKDRSLERKMMTNTRERDAPKTNAKPPDFGWKAFGVRGLSLTAALLSSSNTNRP